MASECPSKITIKKISSKLAIKPTTCTWRGHRPSNQQVIAITNSKPAGWKGQMGITLSALFRVQHTLISHIR